VEDNRQVAAGRARCSLFLALWKWISPRHDVATLWIRVRQKAGVKGRWHDNRHTLVTELADSGAGDEVIMNITGHVSRAMLSGI
jgi:hypothetical protein